MATGGWKIIDGVGSWRVLDDPSRPIADAVSTATLPAPRTTMEPAFGNPLTNMLAAATRLSPTAKAAKGTVLSGADHVKADQKRRQQHAQSAAGAIPLPPPVMPEERGLLDLPLASVTSENVSQAIDAASVANPLLLPAGALWRMVPEDIKTGVEKSVAKNINLLSTPRNAAIAGGLAAANAAGAVFPPAQPAVQALNATAGTYFGAEMLGALPEMNRQYQAALQQGDRGKAAEALTDIAAATAGSAAALRGTASAVRTALQSRAGMLPPDPVTLPNYDPGRYWLPGEPVDMGVRGTRRAEVAPALPPLIARVDGIARPLTPVAPEAAARPHPGIPLPMLKQRLKARAAERADIERMAAEALKEDVPPPAPEAWPVFKSAQESAQVFLDAPAVPKPARESAQVFLGQQDSLGGPQETAMALPAPQVAAPGRRTTQRGSLPFVTPKPDPLTPADAAIRDYIQAREAARKAAAPGALKSLGQVRKDFVRTMIDDTQTMVDYVKAANSGVARGFEHLSAADRMNYLIDRSINAHKVASEFVQRHGIDRIIRGVENADVLDQYLLAKHAQDVAARGFATGRDAAKDAAIIAQYENAVAIPATKTTPAFTYKQIGERVTAAANNLLDEAVRSGIVSEQVAASVKQMYPNYVPISRVFTAIEEGTLQPKSRSRRRVIAGLPEQHVLEALQGSERAIENPIVSLLEQITSRTKQIAQNDAGRFLIETLEESPTHKHLVQPHVSRSAPRAGYDTLSIYRDGKKYTYDVPAELANAAKSLTREEVGRVWHWAVGVPTRLAKLGITGINAPFAAMNVAVDLAHSYIAHMFGTATAAKAQLAAIPAAAKAAITGGDMAQALARHGGGFISTDILRNPSVQTVEAIRANRSPGAKLKHMATHPVRGAGEVLRALEDVMGKSEEFGRLRMYESVRRELVKRGWSPAEAEVKAAVEANNAMPNYMRAGSIGRVLNMVLPYFNAGIQGQRSWMRNLRRGTPAQKADAALRIGLAVFLPHAAATLWNLSDEKRREIYNDIRDYDKADNILLVLDGRPAPEGQSKYTVLRLKLEPGLAKASNVIRQTIESVYGNRPPVEWDEIAKGLIGMISPIGVEPGELASNLLPQTVKPEIQAAANYDLYRDQPIESPAMQRLLKEDRRYPWTSQTAGMLGRVIGLSPIKTEKYLADRFGGVARQALNAADNALALAGVIDRRAVGGTNPLVAIKERFTVARGGAYEGGIFEAKADMKRALAKRYTESIKADPEFKALPDEDKTRALRSVVARAESQVDALDDDEALAGRSLAERARIYRAVRDDLMRELGR